MTSFSKKLQQEYCLSHQNQRTEYIHYKKDEQIINYYCIQCLLENIQLYGTVLPIWRVTNDIENYLKIKSKPILDQLQKQEEQIQKFKKEVQGIFGRWNKIIQEVQAKCLCYQFEDEVKILYSDLNYDDKLENFQRDILFKIQAEKESYVYKIQLELEKIKISVIEFKLQKIIEKNLYQNNQIQLYTQIGEQEQNEYPCGIQISQNQIMASREKEVSLWQIESSQIDKTIKIKKKETFNYHKGRILCSAYSKKIDWFATSGCDGKIFCYKLIAGQWQITKCKYHHCSVYTMILNNKEDQLISGGFEGKVGIWNVNQERNTIVFSYELTESQFSIYTICISPSDTNLALSNIDQTLILWTKNSKTEKYEISDKYQITHIAYRSIFIKEDQIVLSYSHKDVTSVFDIKNKTIIERKDLELKLNDTEVDGDYLFPSIYNSQKQLLIQKYGKYVYVIQQLPNEKLEIIQTIDCQDNFNYGCLSNDGNILIIWDYRSKKFKIYSIQMELFNVLFRNSQYISCQRTEEEKIND